jgi:NAD(P)H dehydrogenase (quinone)
LSNPSSKILVYGANSAQGIPVVNQLLKAGFRVRVFVRDRAKAQSLFGEDVEIFTGMLEDKVSLRSANEGIDRVFLVLPLEYRFEIAVTQGRNAIDAARNAGVKLLVFNSSTNIPAEVTDVAAFEIKRSVEDYLRHSTLPYIVLRPPLYMDNLAALWSMPSIVNQSVVAYPLPAEIKVAWISLDDTAALVVAALARPGLAGSTFDIGGLESVNGQEIAQLFTQVLNRPFTYQQIPIDAFEQGLNQAFGEPTGTEIAKIYRWRAAHPESEAVDMSAILQQLPNALPSASAIELTTFAQWIKLNKWSISLQD